MNEKDKEKNLNDNELEAVTQETNETKEDMSSNETAEVSAVEHNESTESDKVQPAVVHPVSEAAAPAATNSGKAWMYISIGLAVILIFTIVKMPFGGGSSDTVGSVNGVAITKDQLYDEMAKVGGEQTLDNMIQDELIKQEADKAGIVVGDAEVTKEIDSIKKRFPSEAEFEGALQQAGMTLDDLKKQTPMQLRIRKILEPQAKVTDEDVKKYFEENKAQFDEPEQVKASHILVATQEEADAIEKQLKEGADFATLAKEKSTDPGSKEQGGDLGFFGKGAMDPAFEEAAFKLKKDEISAPIKTQYGFHIIKATDHKAAKAATLDEKKADIKEQLIAQKVQELSPTWLEDLKSKSKITNTIKDAAAKDAAQEPTTGNAATNGSTNAK
ncbi:peptidylprolyl isomerase [Paenibacillus sp. CF384]|uniref:peptidylprolyl isomerase n=1 Tax=Paenibacillus sp. CF384 TaxID=1884382 RepID=UPI000895B9E6|nr:peptidylprolyl isomerase [Paenibacillus sp. CF384]SDW28909.1 foldase protein PrsA [Paenibacillus sp. CF384]